MQPVRPLAFASLVMCACGERAPPPLEVVVPPGHVEVSARLSPAECAEAEQVCGNAFGRSCPGVAPKACDARCLDGGAFLTDSGFFMSDECRECTFMTAVICAQADRLGKSACETVQRCERQRRGLIRPP